MRSAFRSAAVPSLRSVPKSQVLPVEGAALASGGSTKLVQAGLGGWGGYLARGHGVLQSCVALARADGISSREFRLPPGVKMMSVLVGRGHG